MKYQLIARMLSEYDVEEMSWKFLKTFDTYQEAKDSILDYLFRIKKNKDFNADVDDDFNDPNHYIVTWWVDGCRFDSHFIIVEVGE